MTDQPHAAAGERPVGRDVLWKLLGGEGLDHCRLLDLPEGPSLAGTVVTIEAGRPCTVSYMVRCGRYWHTREVYVTAVDAASVWQSRELVLVSDGDGNWFRGRPDRSGVEREPIAAVRGCLDIDLAFTPATNTLPIRRYNQAVGAKVPVTAAWVQFPSLDLATIAQEYTRVERARFLYRSLSHDFTAALDVDDAGLVRTYEGLWTRIAEADITR